jgi:PAS domain S-box-containing protein
MALQCRAGVDDRYFISECAIVTEPYDDSLREATMGKNKLPPMDPFESTESIEVGALLTENVTLSGSFDVTQFRVTSFAKLLQTLPLPVILIDESHIVFFANRACEKISPEYETLVGRKIYGIFFDPDSAKTVRSLLEDVFSTRRPQACEAVMGTGKTNIWGRLLFRSIRMEDKRLILLVVEDLTLEKKQLIISQRYHHELKKEVAERKSAEEALEKANRELEGRIRQRTFELLKLNEQLEQEIVERERAQKLLYDSQQRLELALKGADLGLWDYDVESNQAFVDQTWAKIFGYSIEDIQPSTSWWKSLLHPEDRRSVIEAWNAHLAGRTAFYEVEHRVKTKAGNWNWVLSRGKVVERDREGKPLRVAGTASEISDRKRAEEKLLQMSKVFMESIDPIFMGNLEGNIVDLNKAAVDTYGWTRQELIGKSFGTLVSPDLHSTVRELHEQCKRGEKVENVEILTIKRSGSVIPVLISLSLLTNKKGEPVGIASITKDLSDLKHTEEMLRAKTDALEKSNKDLEEFAYVAAHDLREPLVGIAAYLKILERRFKGKLDPDAHKFVSRSLEITLRMDSLVQNLLAYARLGTGSKSLEPTDCTVSLDRALSNLRSAIEEADVRVISGPLPTVMANPSQLVQVFQNLLSNAIKFASDRPLEIRVGATREESRWKFYVKDNGIGIEPPYFDRIFRIFQRIEASGEIAGTGIGLANCKKIVEQLGGRIWVESESGRGSTFFFTVPDPRAPIP